MPDNPFDTRPTAREIRAALKTIGRVKVTQSYPSGHPYRELKAWLVSEAEALEAKTAQEEAQADLKREVVAAVSLLWTTNVSIEQAVLKALAIYELKQV